MKKLDLTSLARLGEGNTTAQVKCIYTFHDGFCKEPKLFIGNTHGKIVYPRSSIPDAFGWDPIFELYMELKNSLHGPVRYLTYAEMPYETKDRYSDRYLAFDKLKVLQHSKSILINYSRFPNLCIFILLVRPII